MRLQTFFTGEVKGKGKDWPRRGYEGPEGEQRYSSTLSLTSALDGGGWLTLRPGSFTPGNDIQFPLYGRVCGPQGRSRRMRKILLPLGLFFCILLYPVLHQYLFLRLDFPAFCLLVCTLQHTIIHVPAGFEPATPASDWPQTLGLDISATGIGIRFLDRPLCSESLYRLSYTGPVTGQVEGIQWNASVKVSDSCIETQKLVPCFCTIKLGCLTFLWLHFVIVISTCCLNTKRKLVNAPGKHKTDL